MSKKIAAVLAFGLLALAGCTQGINPTDTDRALIGAGTGAVIADLSGHSVLGGAAAGAAAGALCDDVRLCQ
ncbi:hypothetical protein RM190_04595 [Paracoccus sp. CPCC 101403]|uniref:17 kDa surface antigen n=2 Tax=Paracoccus broussonetiae TaxID=3075834 RepID=A0ABU3EA81_9RHOB|nr:hypothetical protein [Paracoccus sp. CPCC 101403]MDT1061127.1 hypothetical protein [Paracoccus sp. CPCC 101403]